MDQGRIRPAGQQLPICALKDLAEATIEKFYRLLFNANATS
jgi:hypothetical protein